MDEHGSGGADIFEFHEEADEELWIVSYADMVTLLFGFFVILYSFSNLDEKKFEEAAKDMAKTFEGKEEKEEKPLDPNAERKIKAFEMLISMLNIAENAEQAMEKIENLKQKDGAEQAAKDLLKEALQDESLKDLFIQAPNESNISEIILPDLSIFKPGSAELISSADKKIQILARDFLALRDLAEVEVIGHTDHSVPGRNASFKDNFTLSSMRAGAVAQKLIRYGLPEKLVSVRGMGGLRPIAPEKDKNGRMIPENMAKNRRVHIVLRRRTSADGS